MKLFQKILPVTRPLVQARRSIFQGPKNQITDFIEKINTPDENLKIILSSKDINKVTVYANDLLNRYCRINVEIDFVRNSMETVTLKYDGNEIGKILEKILQDLNKSNN